MMLNVLILMAIMGVGLVLGGVMIIVLDRI